MRPETNGPAPETVFEPLTYRPFRPQAWRANGALTITRGGVAMRPSTFDRTLYAHRWVRLRAATIALASIVRRGKVAVPSEKPLALIHSIWSAGYYHWITESLPRAMAARDAFPEAIPLLPRDHFGWAAQSLSAIGIDKIAWYPEEANAIVDRPVLTDCPRQFGTTDPSVLRHLRQVVRDSVGTETGPTTDPIIYVSRAKARGRRVRNEDEVTAMLRSYGARIVCFEDLDFNGQVRLMSGAQLLVSIHGAGLTNMMWMNDGGAVVELLPRRNGLFDWNVVRGSFGHDACYVRLASAVGLRHHGLLCEAHNGRFEESWHADITVDVEALDRLIRTARQ